MPRQAYVSSRYQQVNILSLRLGWALRQLRLMFHSLQSLLHYESNTSAKPG